MKKIDREAGKFTNSEHAETCKAKWKSCGIKTESSFFGLNKVLELLAVKGVTGLRIHYGMDEDGNMEPILTAELETNTESVRLLDASVPCPPFCQQPPPPPDNP